MSLATSFAHNAFYVNQVDMIDASCLKPRAIAVNTGALGGAEQARQLIATEQYKEVGVTWVDPDHPLGATGGLLNARAVELSAQSTEKSKAILAADGYLASIIEKLMVRPFS